MGRNILRILTFCCCIFCCLEYNTVRAQQVSSPNKAQDYMVYDNGDTIYGKFKKRLFGALRFVSDGKSYIPESKYFKYYYSSKEKLTYQKIIINKKSYWFAIIEYGAIRLLEQIDNNFLANGRSVIIRRWIVQKDNGPFLEIKSNGPEGLNDNGRLNLEHLINDDPALYEQLHQTKEYSYKNVRYIIQEYNRRRADSAKQ